MKKFPTDILSIFTDKMLAVWYMDDGSNNHGSVTLSTHSFSFKDQKIIIDFLKNKYHINLTIVKDRKQWKISIGRKDYNHFLSIVTPFILKAMAYKIDNPRIDLSFAKVQDRASNKLAKTSVPERKILEKV